MTNQNSITTIKLQKETKSRLDKLKEHNKESYEEILRKMLYILNTLRKKPELAQKILMNINRNIKRQQRYTSDNSKNNLQKPKFKTSLTLKQNPQHNKGSH